MPNKYVKSVKNIFTKLLLDKGIDYDGNHQWECF